MRIARLDLLRYGRFTDVSIELPRAERDIHIVFGPNEAGKTTSLTAIEDMLFGIPKSSPYSFLHSYQTMCIGAVLEGSGNRFEFQRLKKRRDMILGPDGNPLPGDERLLAPFLGGADRDYFDRMFNLSHGRLAEGGRAIIEAKDDVGQMLFAAGTGLADLRERLKKMEEEADKLWAPRNRSEKRLYHQAQNRWKEAKSRQRKHELSVREWEKAHKRLSDAEETLRKHREEHQKMSKDLKKLVRICHVHGIIRQQHELKRKITALGDVIELAEDANDQLTQAERKKDRIKGQIEIFAAQMNEDKQALEAITFDAALVQRSDEIEQLNEQRIAVRSERKDLPKRQDEYCLELKSLARLAVEIGWNFEKPSELIERIPSRSKVEPVRELLTRHGKLEEKLHSAQEMLEEGKTAWQDKTEDLNEIGEAADVSRLAAVLDDVREIGDVADRICREQRQVTEISCEIDKKVRLLRPALPAGTDIEALAVPPRDMVVAHRDDVRDWARRQGETKQQLTEARNHLERDQKALERRVRYEGVMGLGAVEEARSDRGALWDLVKAQYITRLKISSEDQQAYAEALDDLPASFEGAVAQADIVADRRFDKAKAAAELVLLERKIAGHKTHISQLEVSKAELKVEGERQDQKWQELWAELPIELLAPDVMLVWLEARREVVTLIGREREMQCQLDNSRREEQKAIAQVHAELTKLGWDSGDIMGDSLGVVVKMADAYRQKQEVKAQKIVDMCEAVQTAKSKVARRQGELERAEAERKIWQADWDKAVAAIDLQCDDKPEVLSAQINAIDQMREHAVAAKDLRDKRIATIERDIEIFARAVAEVAAELAPDLMDGDADASVVALDRLREEALKLQQQHREDIRRTHTCDLGT